MFDQFFDLFLVNFLIRTDFMSVYSEQSHLVWVNHFKDAVKRLRYSNCVEHQPSPYLDRLSITFCIGFLLLGLWRLFLLWRRRRRQARSRLLLWDAFFGRPTNHIRGTVNARVLSAL